MSSSPPHGLSEGQQAELVQEPPLALDPPRFLTEEELESIGRKGRAWLEVNTALVDSLATGTVLLINLGTGEYETGSDRDTARRKFDARFGATTIGYHHRVRMPYTMGAGLWALNSAV